MAGNLTWTMGLADKMSGPARAMSGGLDALTGRLRTAGAASDAFAAKQTAAFKAQAQRNVFDGAKARGGLATSTKDVTAGSLSSNMAKHDVSAFTQAKKTIDAATRALDAYAKARSKADGGTLGAARATMGKTGANSGGLGVSKPDTNWISKILSGLNSIHPAAARAGASLVGIAGRAGPALAKLGPILGAVAGPVGMVVSAIAQIGMAAIGAFAIAGAAAARYIGQMQVLKQSTMFAFAATMGGQTQAAAGWNKMAATAIKIGVPLDQMSSSMTKLMAQGFGFEDADRLVKRMADLKAVNPAADLDRISTAISQIKAKGRLQQEELSGQLADTGLAPEAVYEVLARKLKTDKAGVLKAMQAGKIDSAMGIAAIEEAMAKQTGGGAAGAMAEKLASTTILGGIGRLQARIQAFAAGLKIDFAPVGQFLDRIGLALEGDSGTKFGNAIEKGLNGALALLDRISEKDLASVFDAATWAIEKIGAGLEFAGWAIDKLSGIGDFLSKVNSAIGLTDMLAFAWYAVANPIQAVGIVIESLYTRIAKVVAALTGFKMPELKIADQFGSLGFDKSATATATPAAAAKSSNTSDPVADAIRKATTPAPGQPGAPGAAGAPAPTTPTIPAPVNKTISITVTGYTDTDLTSKIQRVLDENDRDN